MGECASHLLHGGAIEFELKVKSPTMVMAYTIPKMGRGQFYVLSHSTYGRLEFKIGTIFSLLPPL